MKKRKCINLNRMNLLKMQNKYLMMMKMRCMSLLQESKMNKIIKMKSINQLQNKIKLTVIQKIPIIFKKNIIPQLTIKGKRKVKP
jgi:hypothetical protein